MEIGIGILGRPIWILALADRPPSPFFNDQTALLSTGRDEMYVTQSSTASESTHTRPFRTPLTLVDQ